MKTKVTLAKPSKDQMTTKSEMKTRGLAAAKAMSKTLREEHRRWNMPLLAWKDGKVVKIKP